MNLKKLIKRSKNSSSKARSAQPTQPPSTTNLHTPTTSSHPSSTTTLHSPTSTTTLHSPTSTTATTSSSTTHHIVPNAPAEQSVKPTNSASSTTSPINASPARTLLDAFQFSVTILREVPLPGIKLAANAVLELLRRSQVGHETASATRFC